MQVITAPMAGVTDYSFRKILYEFSPDIVFTEMMDVSALKYNNQRTVNEILRRVKGEAVQIFGSRNDDFLQAVKILTDKGFHLSQQYQVWEHLRRPYCNNGPIYYPSLVYLFEHSS